MNSISNQGVSSQAIFPQELHLKIMKRVFIEKVKKPLLAYSTFFLLNFGSLIWHLNNLFLKEEARAIFLRIIADFDLSLSFLGQILLFLGGRLLSPLSLSFAFSIGAVCYSLRKIVTIIAKLKTASF